MHSEKSVADDVQKDSQAPAKIIHISILFSSLAMAPILNFSLSATYLLQDARIRDSLEAIFPFEAVSNTFHERTSAQCAC
jgi:hypothetical protein